MPTNGGRRVLVLGGGITGLATAVARRIVQARAQAPFASVDDLRTRARLSEADLKRLQDQTLFL